MPWDFLSLPFLPPCSYHSPLLPFPRNNILPRWAYRFSMINSRRIPPNTITRSRRRRERQAFLPFRMSCFIQFWQMFRQSPPRRIFAIPFSCARDSMTSDCLFIMLSFLSRREITIIVGFCQTHWETDPLGCPSREHQQTNAF